MPVVSSPATIPEITFPEQLPVSARREDIAAALAAHQVVIVCGETGSGKTTQLPKIAYAAGLVRDCARVGMTQPRRIAAKSVAMRLAQETRTDLGGFVGWQVRFTDQVGPATRIKVMTDGILLAETQSDPEFRVYDTLILDEAHERSLNIDFLLGYLRTLLPRRPGLKLILSSATLEAERFSRYFGGAPVVEVSGRTWPVEVRYRPLQGMGDGKGGMGKSNPRPSSPTPHSPSPIPEDLDTALLAAVDELAAEGPGDILVFMPGEREIREAQEALRKHHPEHTEILPLYARLSVGEQEKVFQPHGGRRIVLATNVAETSLTVPGIRYVVDTGLARVKRYSLRNKIEQLKVENVSRASANQRAGRCGRVAAGVCIRLYDEQDYLARPEYTTPELLRSSLAGVILRMKALGLPDIQAFPFPDPPEPKRVRDGLTLLAELNALDPGGRLTAIGRQLAHLPLDPKIGRMLIAARDKACLAEVLVIAAFLSCQDPRERPQEQAQAADERHRRFADERSDFVAILNLWRHVAELNAHRKSRRKFQEALKADFLSPNRVREWRDVHGQLTVLVKELGWNVGDGGWEMGDVGPASSHTPSLLPHYAALHQALLPGLLGNLGMLTEDGGYLGARGMKFSLFPGSGVKKKPKWAMAAEIVETRRVYARTVARVEPEWIEHTARHLLKVSYADPHWSKKPAHVSAAMRATLYGLPVVNGRPVHYGPIDPGLCREIFIRHALVRGEWDCRAAFFQHNRRLLEEMEDLSQRARDPRLAVDEQAVYDFFDAIVPAGLHNGAAFERWRREAERAQPRRLFLDRGRLLAGHRDATDGFPSELTLDGTHYALSYRFKPGAEDDGVTLAVPLAALNQLPEARCDWLVPGLLEEKITALIKSLPQSVRRAYVPVPEYARAAAQALGEARDGEWGMGDGKRLQTPSPIPLHPSLTNALGAFLERATGTAVPRDAWRPEALPAHLAMNYRVEGEDGRVLAQGRDLAELRRQFGAEAQKELGRSATALEREGITAWDFDTLPERVEVDAGKQRLTAFPALATNPDGSVSLRLFDSRPAARDAHRRGVCRLVWLAHPALLRQTERDLAASLKLACLQYQLMDKTAGCTGLVRDILLAACLEACPTDPAEVRTAAASTDLATRLRPLLPERVHRTAGLVADCLSRAHTLQQALAKAPATWREAVLDMQAQLDDLVRPGFVADTPPAWLQRIPHYLRAISLRLDKLPKAQARDTQAMREFASLAGVWAERRSRQVGPERDPALEDFRWRLEELRIALFAQEVKTLEATSVKRLEKRWAEIAGPQVS